MRVHDFEWNVSSSLALAKTPQNPKITSKTTKPPTSLHKSTNKAQKENPNIYLKVEPLFEQISRFIQENV